MDAMVKEASNWGGEIGYGNIIMSLNGRRRGLDFILRVKLLDQQLFIGERNHQISAFKGCSEEKRSRAT